MWKFQNREWWAQMFKCHEPLSEHVGADVERVSDCFLDVVRKSVIVECDDTKWNNFHHGPDWWIVSYAIFGCKMSYFRIIGSLVRGIGYSREKPIVLRLRELRHVRWVDECERIADKIGVASGYDGANSYFNSCKGIHRHEPQMAVEHVDAPYGFKCGVRAIRLGMRNPKWIKVASESVVADGFQHSNECVAITYDSTTFDQSREIRVGLRRFSVRLHCVSPKKKIPVATIGLSLSGGVTGCIVPNFYAWRKGAKFVFYGNRVEKQERKAA